jgi:CheY-like chemotaxis protein
MPAGMSRGTGSIQRQLNLDRKKILIVEDDPATELLHKTYLEHFGDVHACLDGLHAWEYLNTGAKVDLIVTDHEMPRMTGKDLVLKVRAATASFKDTPIMMVTASITSEEMAGCGLQYFFDKPVEFSELRKAAEAILFPE